METKIFNSIVDEITHLQKGCIRDLRDLEKKKTIDEFGWWALNMVTSMVGVVVPSENNKQQ